MRDLGANVQELYAQQQALIRELQREQRALQDTLGILLREMQDGRAETARRMTNVEESLLLLQELQGVSQQQLASLRDQIERDRRQGVFGSDPGFTGTGMPGGVGAANDLYQSGVTQFRRGQYSAARIAFGDIVDSYPNDPVAPDARFFLAQILVEEGEAEEALEAFLQIPEYHPASERAPEAYYHAALLYLELGDRAEAERHLDLVINTWPESDAAALARDTVRELR